MESQLQILSDLQQQDSRIAALEAEVARLPKQITAIETALVEAKKSLEVLRGRQDKARRDLRAKEKDLEVVAVRRSKSESRLYEVKTNKEYSAVLAEIETLKLDKGRLEEEILALMELQERLAREVAEADTRLTRQEQDARVQEAAATEELRALDADLTGVRGERESLRRDIPRDLIGQYERLLKGRAGLAVALVGSNGTCSGCRVAITPQRFQEVRTSSQILTCESCGRILYYQP